MQRIIRCVCGIICLMVLQGCIENDIPYPVIKLQILKLTAEGQVGNTVIDNDNRTVNISFDESVYLDKIQLRTLELTEGAQTELAANSVINLTSPHKVKLSLYQDYEWTIIGKQNIERYFIVEGQVKESTIDINSHRAIAYVSKSTNLKNIAIKKLKLGHAGGNYSRSIDELHDFVKSNSIVVSYGEHQLMESWTLYVFQVESEVTTDVADAWVNVAWLKGQGKEEVEKSFEYRIKGEDEWKVSTAEIEVNGGSFSACLTHLSPATTYEYRAKSDGKYGEIVTFTTATLLQLTDGNMDNWHKNGKVWNPWLENGASFWDSGNKGATTLGESITTPTSDIWNGKATGQAAKMESKFIGLGGIGKFAAGNLFVGQYVRTDGTNGVLAFGRPYTSYPTKLNLYYKYSPALMNYVDDELKNRVIKNNPDTCSIYVALGDWSTPVEIRTKKSERKLFDPNDEHVIAYAEFCSAEKVSDYKKLSLELKYRATNRRPTYMFVVCSASKYGDYFTGGEGSLLYLDEMSFEFDY